MDHQSQTPPVVLSIAGSDCSAGAGIQADLKTFSAHQAYGLTCVTAVVAESPHEVRSVTPIPLSSLRDQLECLISAYPIQAIKTGLLYSTEQIELISEFLKSSELRHVDLVIDPVMIASTGDALTKANIATSLQEHLFPHATLITPNLSEAATLLGRTIGNSENLGDVAIAIAEKCNTNCLLKGGHSNEELCTDYLAIDGNLHQFSSPRLKLESSHGTGCTTASAIAVNIAKRQHLIEAVANAKQWVFECLSQSHTFKTPDTTTIALNHSH